MGHRANFVVVDEHGWRLYQDHAAARDLAALLVRGPHVVRHAVEKLARIDDGDRHAVRGWYSDSFAEGGAILDATRRRLLFHGTDGGAFDTPETRVFRELLRRVWRDWHWEVRWAYDGQGDLVGALGLDRSLVRSRWTPTTPYVVDDPTRPDQGIHLLTVRTAEGAVRAWPCDADDPERHTGWQGPALLERPPRALDGHGGDVPSDGVAALTPASLTLGAIPVSGTHVDVPERTVGVWTGATCEQLLPALADRWPGWRTEFWGDRYEQQLLACEGAVSVPAFDALGALENVLARLPAGRGTPLRAGIKASQKDPTPYGHVARSTAGAERSAPDEERDWYWVGRAVGYLLRDLGRAHTEPGTPAWQRRVRPAPALPDFLRARLDDADRAVEGAARLENNVHALEYWFRTAFTTPFPEYRAEVTHWPEWKVLVAREQPFAAPPGSGFGDDFLTVGPYRLNSRAPLDGAAKDRLRDDATLAGAHLARHSPARARADLVARRRLLDRYERAVAEVDRLLPQCPEGSPTARRAWVVPPEVPPNEGVSGTPAMAAALTRRHTLFLTLRDLAAAFADHPDHDPEWSLPAGGPYRP
ncbi:DUF6221 family protein [Streptomyces odontomachi]|uniref:DUF6221 family protein n=1 Tax=Streptomyces odontomachi TaxID=2944940 RepID=UPI0021094177|nr:DUF6221 family protein [Streptomyces sp. ODS25]